MPTSQIMQKSATKLALITLPLALVLAACSTTPASSPLPNTPSPVVNDTYPKLPPAQGIVRLKEGESVFLKDQQINVKFVKVLADNRCPLNARCIWAGNATVAIEVMTPTSRPQVVNLSVGDLRGDLMRTASVVGKDITLQTLYPMPSTSLGFEQLQGKYVMDVKVTPHQ